MPELSPAIQKLIRDYQDSCLKQQPEEGVITLRVDEITSKVASFYEKIRQIVDWKEEHLIRKTAIERALKRRLISELSGFGLTPDPEPKEIAESLILELIRGGHFPNDQIPQEKVGDVQKTLEKYIYILENNPLNGNSSPNLKEKINFYSWILEIAACEIEEILAPPLKENALIELMTSLMEERIVINPEGAISDEEKKIQIYIAVHRALFHLDSPIISYHLLEYWYPQWGSLSGYHLAEIAKNILSIRDAIEGHFSHPLSSEFLVICERHDTVYRILDDILGVFSEDPSVISKEISKLEALRGLIKRTYNKRLSTLKARLFRAAIYSTFSIFIASGFSLFVIEVPLARLFYGRFNLIAIIVDIAVPTLLMFFLVALIKPPPERNLSFLIAEIQKVVYQREERDIYEIKVRKKKRTIVGFFVTIMYILGFFLSLGATVGVFFLARIPLTSVFIDTLNVAVVIFAALVIRERAKEITVEEETGFRTFLIDTLSVPIAKLGQRIAETWKEYNVVSVFLTALVDMPLLTFIEFVDDWNSLLREKKAGMR